MIKLFFKLSLAFSILIMNTVFAQVAEGFGLARLCLARHSDERLGFIEALSSASSSLRVDCAVPK